MKRGRRHLGTSGVLFMGVLVALAALGVVYGLWSKNLLINGTVRTGDLNADWDAIRTNDPSLLTVVSPDPCTPELNPTGCVAPRKDVGSCDARVLGTGETEWPGQVAEVLIRNAYPSYECTVDALITNTGTIPFNLTGAAIDLPPADPAGTQPPLDVLCRYRGLWPEGDPTDPQIDPEQEGWLSCWIHVNQTAKQSTSIGGQVVDPVTYRFRLKACVAQWNEEASFAQCVDSPQHEGPPN